MKKLTDKEIREAAEVEKKKRAEETMRKINELLKEANCTIIPVGQFQGNNLSIQLTILAN